MEFPKVSATRPGDVDVFAFLPSVWLFPTYYGAFVAFVGAIVLTLIGRFWGPKASRRVTVCQPTHKKSLEVLVLMRVAKTECEQCLA